jgi:putative transposase
LLIFYRDIELNPVRANMVNDPADYIWSSYRCNALGVESLLFTSHEEYVSLGKMADDCHHCYRELFSYHIDVELLSDIREALNKGLALGRERFRDEVEVLYGRHVKPGKMGRPKSIRKIGNERTG